MTIGCRRASSMLFVFSLLYFLPLSAATAELPMEDMYADAISMLENGDYEGAEDLLDDCIRSNSSFAEAYYHRGVARHCLGKNQLAMDDYSTVIELTRNIAPDIEAAAYNGRGNVHMSLAQITEAIADYSAALARKPDYAKAYSNRGYAFLGIDASDSAILDFERAGDLGLPLEPEILKSVYLGYGDQMVNEGNYELATRQYTKVIQMEPGNGSLYCRRGIALLGMEQYGATIEDESRACSLLEPRIDSMTLPILKKAFFYRGLASHFRGRYWAAAQDFQRSLGIECQMDMQFDVQTALIAYFNFQKVGGRDDARAMLDEAELRCLTPDSGLFQVVRYLRGGIRRADLLNSALGNDDLTRVKVYYSMDLIRRGMRREAQSHLIWVKYHGNRSLDEYIIALNLLEP